jgi:hypothetical protein
MMVLTDAHGWTLSQKAPVPIEANWLVGFPCCIGFMTGQQ